jgi:hypothetical protein
VRPMRAARIVVGFTIFGCALIVGFLPLSSQDVDCGSALRGSPEAAAVDSQNSLRQQDLIVAGNLSAEQRCATLRNRVKIPMGVLAVGAFLAPFAVRHRRPRGQTPRPML